MQKLIKWDDTKNDWIYLSVNNALNADKLGNEDAASYAKNIDLQNLDSDNTQQHNEILKSISSIDSNIQQIKKDNLSPTYGNYKIIFNEFNDTLEIVYIGDEQYGV